MNWVDLVIILLVIAFAAEGIKRGFFIQLVDILGLLTSLTASLIFYPQGAQLLIQFFSLPKIAANPLGFLLIWIATESLFSLTASVFLAKLIALLAICLENNLTSISPFSIDIKGIYKASSS